MDHAKLDAALAKVDAALKSDAMTPEQLEKSAKAMRELAKTAATPHGKISGNDIADDLEHQARVLREKQAKKQK